MKYLYTAIFVGLTVTLVASVILLPRKVIISDITCTNQFGECDASLTESLQVGIGKNYIDARKTLEGILEFNTLISDYSTTFVLPDKLSVSVVRRKPRFALANNTELVALVDEIGVVVGYENETLLPIVRKDGDFAEVGSKVSDDELHALQIALGSNTISNINRAEIRNGELVVELKNGRTLYFPQQGEIDVLLGSLVMVLAKLESDSELSQKVEIIDLRFQNPVLR